MLYWIAISLIWMGGIFSEGIIIGICGASASGKTTLATRLQHLLPHNVTIISQDSYFKHLPHLSLQERIQFNWDCPDGLDIDLLCEQLMMIKQGYSIEQPVRNFYTFSRELFTKTVHPAPIIIVEGILIFAIEEIRKLCDIKIYIDAEADIRLIRRVRRDLQERGMSIEDILSQYVNHVKPMHKKLIEPSQIHADVIIPHGGENPISLDFIESAITQKIRLIEQKK